MLHGEFMANKLIEDIFLECTRVRTTIIPMREKIGDREGVKEILEVIEGAEASTFETSDNAIILQAGALATLRDYTE